MLTAHYDSAPSLLQACSKPAPSLLKCCIIAISVVFVFANAHGKPLPIELAGIKVEITNHPETPVWPFAGWSDKVIDEVAHAYAFYSGDLYDEENQAIVFELDLTFMADDGYKIKRIGNTTFNDPGVETYTVYAFKVSANKTPSIEFTIAESGEDESGGEIHFLPVEMMFTDITGFKGIGATPASEVPRIPIHEQADGIACDWQEGVEDGALLLIRVIGPKDTQLGVQFNLLPPDRDGEYISLSPDDKLNLQGLGLSLEGDIIKTTKRVYGMKAYRSPNEFDLATPNNPDKERVVPIKARVEIDGITPQPPTGPLVPTSQVPLEKNLTLVRPPLVLVHGVNSNKPGDAAWGSFCKKFEDEWGFVCRDFRVDHWGVDISRPAEKETWGFGEISSTCLKVRDKITYSTKEFRNGKYFSKKIAVQKVDVVGHSYGGLLTRCYTEMSGATKGKDFSDRRDVRKIITLGTPHKGSPLANMVCEVFANPLIANARSEGISGFEYTMTNLLDLIDVEGIGTGGVTGPGFVTGKLPNALDDLRNRPRHAYQIFSVNSERLNNLNSSPLHNDIGYAALSGTEDSMYWGFLGGVDFKTLVPNYDTYTPFDAKPYFPWIDLFTHDGVDLDGTDAIVPKWSSKISTIAADYAEINANHVELTDKVGAMNNCREWLNRKLSLGSVHRPAWIPVPVSERNAYQGSQLADKNDENSDSIGAGLRSDAIVKVELKDGDTKSFRLSTDPSVVGIYGATLTGMIKKSRIATETLALISDEILTLDEVLNKVDVAALNFKASDLVGAGPDHYIPFTLRDVKYGRKYANVATGPDGESDATDTVLIGYNLGGLPKQSPPTELILPDYVLEPPAKTGLKLDLSGAIDVSGAGNGSQSVETRVYDHNFLLPNNLLETKAFTLTHPASVWDGVLIPYNTSVTLHIDSSGNVAGAQGSSNENPAQVLQYLVRPGLASNPKSTTVVVP